MKCKIKNAGYFLLSMMILTGVLSAKGNDLYIYLANGTKQTIPVSDVQKLTFTETALSVEQTSGAMLTSSFDELAYFSLKKTSGSSAEGVNVLPVTIFPTLITDNASVTSATDILRLEVLDLQGRPLVQSNPGKSQVELSLASFPAGIYLLSITNETGITVKKIIKK